MEQHCIDIPSGHPQFHPHPGSLNGEETRDLDNTSLSKRSKMLGNVTNHKKVLGTKTHTNLENVE